MQTLDSRFSVLPTINNEENFTLIYNGILNRTEIKNLTVTLLTSNNQGFSQTITISIIVSDVLNDYKLSDGLKTIDIIYVDGYMNSIKNISLGSVFVHDLDDWFHSNRIYSINSEIFTVSQGILRTSEVLYPGLYTVYVNVTKMDGLSTALSTMNINIKSIDSESIRQAAVIRIQGKLYF